MEIKLSKSIAELEENIKFIWQPPDIYDDVHNNYIWLVYGRKGSGKSTLVDYLGKKNGNNNVIIVRPRNSELFRKIKAATTNYDGNIDGIEEAISTALDFALTSHMIRVIVSENKSLDDGHSEELNNLISFLRSHDLEKGKIFQKAIKFLSGLSVEGFTITPNLTNLLDTVDAKVTFSDAKEALYEYVKIKGIEKLMCIDDIDEMGFTYSKEDKSLINALLILMVRKNLIFIERGIKLRILITAPSELFFQSSLWGSDWVTPRSRCLQWKELVHLKELVNKRIAVELNVHKSKPRFPDDKYSIATEQTWNRLFPTNIYNKIGRREETFLYILRHTFYTPRQILDLCDFILKSYEQHKIPINLIISQSKQVNASIIQSSVEEFSYRIRKDIIDVFSRIYYGLEEVMKAFQQRPNVWLKNQLIDFVKSNNLMLIEIENENEFKNENLIKQLQIIGFLGLGNRSIGGVSNSFDIRFSFLEYFPTYKSWEIAAISPLFYDSYDIRPVDDIIVSPHAKLSFGFTSYQKLVNYNHITNIF